MKDKQDYKLDEIEEEGNQSKSSDQSSESDNLFSSNRQIKVARTQKKKTLLCEKLIRTYSAYLQFLSGNQLEEVEQNELKKFLGNLTNTRLAQMTDKYQYLTEFDYHMGDVVIAFPNPDSPLSEDLGTLTQLEAIQLCLNCFASNKYSTEFEVMDNLILIKAIEQNLYMLQPEDEELARQYEQEDRLNDEIQQPQRISQRQNTDENLESKKSVSRKDKFTVRRWGDKRNQFSEELNRIEQKLRQIYCLDKNLRAAAIKEVFNLDNDKLDRFIRIKLSRGQFLEYDEQSKEWQRTGKQTKDFTTLIRMVVILQLSKIGFLMRQFISNDGSTIFLVLYQTDHNLKVLASKYEITKQLNFQFQDIFSYEPVDDNLRPLRLNNRLWKSNSDYKRDLTPMFIYLKPKIVDLIEKINFKQLAREVNQSQINQQIFSQGDEEVIDDYAPSDEVWKAYYSYLLYLEDKIKKFRAQFVIKDDLAQFINKNNKSKKPYEIYMERNQDKIQFQDQINSQDIQILESIDKSIEIEQKIDLYGRNPELLSIFKGIYQIIQEQKHYQKYYSQVKGICNIQANKYINSKEIKVLKKHQIAKQYFELFQEALTITNCYGKKVLNTIWELSEIEPFEPFIIYTLTDEKLAKSQQCKLNAIWKQYCITETQKISLFSNMERIKINSMALNEKINFTMLISEKFVASKFSLNDQYEIFGKSNKKLFHQLFSKKQKIETIKQKAQYMYFTKEMSERQYLEIQGQNKYENQEYFFTEKKLENLAYQWRFQWKQPWYIPVKEIRNYYGEKIAIYFTFVGYNASMLFPIALAGSIFNIGEWIFFDQSSSLYVYFYIVFGFIQISWGNLVHDMWQTKEKVFAMQFGQFNQSGDDNTQQRSQFIGYYSRSIESDNLNILFFPNSKMLLKKIFTFTLLIMLILIYIGIIVGIFMISEVLQDVNQLTNGSNEVALFDVTIPAFINLLFVLVLDKLFDKAVIMLTDYENHKTIKMYEANFIYKKFFISFFSQCMPVLEISFLHKTFGLHCSQNNCLKHSGYHFATMFLFQFLINVFMKTKGYVIMFFISLYKDLTEKQQNKTKFVKLNLQSNPTDQQKGSKSKPQQSSQHQRIHSHHKSNPKNQSLDIKKSPASNLQDYQNEQLQFFQGKDQVENEIIESHNNQDKNNDEENTNPFKLINNYIEQQHFEKESYEISPERYGTVDDFMEILIQHAMLVLFGTTFSLAYLIAFLRSLLELQCDKLKLFNLMQRPIPISESSIGVWNKVLDGLAYLQLLVNTAQIAFQREVLVTSDTFIQTSGFFLICLLINFSIRFVEITLFNELPFQIQDLLKRQIYLIKFTVEKFKGSKDKSSGKSQNLKNLKRYPILKIYGCKNKDVKKKDLVELSSDSDVEDYIKRMEEIKSQGQPEVKKQPKKVEPKKKLKAAHKTEQENEDIDEEQQIEKQDSQNMKLLQQASNKEQSIEELQQFFSVRKSNWALKFKMKDTNDKEQQLLQKIFFQKTLTFLKMKDQLNPHQKQWTFDRYTQRKFYLPRSLVLIRNLDWRRYLIFKESDKRLKKNLKLKQLEKYRQQLDFLNKFLEIQQNKVEKMEIKKKMKQYVQKHLWVDGRSTVFLRSGGVWFGQFRKSTSKISGVKIAENYYKILERFKKVSESETKTQNTEQDEMTNEMKEQLRQDEKKTLKTKPIDEQFFNLTCNLTNTQFNKFSFTSFISLIDSLTIKNKEHLVCQTSSKGISQVEYQLDNYLGEGFRKQNRIMSFSYIPFRIQAPLLKVKQFHIWENFVQEQINSSQPRIHLIYRLDKTKEQFSSNINTNVYALQPSIKKWLSSNIDLPKIQDIQLYFCTEITYNRMIHKDFVNRVYRFYDQIEGSDYLNLTLQIGIAKINYCKIVEQNQFCSFKDPVIKGYLCRQYAPMKNSQFCNGKTLTDVIKGKKKKYSDSEIQNFIISTIKLFDLLQQNFGMFHGSLSTESFLLVQKQDKFKHLHYVIYDFGMFYWYDLKTTKTHFLRPIQQNNELWYLSPELLHNYLNPNNQTAISPQKCDMYSLGIVCLQMVTLGKLKVDLEQSLQEYDGDVAFTVRKWMMNNKNSLIQDYPNSSQLIMELLHPDQKSRIFPTTLAARFPGKSMFHEKVEETVDYEQELDQMLQKRFCPFFYSDDNILYELEENQQKQQNVSLKSYLKQSVFGFEQYVILNQNESFDTHSQDFEEIMNKQYFQNEQTEQTEINQFLQNFENKARNCLGDFIKNQLDEFKYFVLYFQYKIIFLQQINDIPQALKYFNTLFKLFDEIDKIVSLVSFPTSMESSQIEVKNEEKQEVLEKLIELGKSQIHLQKYMKQFSHHFKIYQFQMIHLGIQINFLLSDYQEAISFCKRSIEEQLNEIKYQLKYCEKDNNHFLITNQILIKLLSRIQVSIFQSQNLCDSNDSEQIIFIDEILNDLTIFKQFLMNEKISDKQCILKSILKSSKPKLLNHELMQSAIGFIDYFQSKILFLKLSCQNKQKLPETTVIANTLQKNLLSKICIIEQLKFTPMLGWIGEYYSEIEQTDQMILIFNHIVNLMEEQFIIYESFQIDSTIYFNYLRISITNLIQYGSQLILYNSVQSSNGILQGFMQIIQNNNLYSQNCLLNNIMQIKLVHILLELQNLTNPYYFKQNDDQLEYNHEIPNSVLNNSLISVLQKLYHPILKYLTLRQNQQQDLENSWFNNDQLVTMKLELLYGYRYAVSKQNIETEFDGSTNDIHYEMQKLIEFIETNLHPENVFVKLENQILRTRAYQLSYNYQLAFECIEVSKLLQKIQYNDYNKKIVQSYFFSIIDSFITNHFYNNNQISFKEMMLLETMSFIKGHKFFQVRFFITKLLDLFLKNQQIELNNDLIKFFYTLYSNQAKLLKKEKYLLKLTLEIYKVRNYIKGEELRSLVEKQDKKDNILIQDLFESVQNAFEVVQNSKVKKSKKKKQKVLTKTDISRYLIAQQLEQQDMDKIQQSLIHIDDIDQGFNQQVTLCQLGVKLIIYQLHVGQFRDADSMSYNIKRKLFDLIYFELCKMVQQWQSEKVFLTSSVTEISVNQLFKSLNIHEQNFENYEHNLLVDIDPLKNIAINVRNFLALKQVLFMRLLYSYVEGLQALCIIMRGDFKLSKQNLSYVQQFGESNIEEIKAVIINLLMQFEIITADYNNAAQKSISLLKILSQRQKQNNLHLKTSWFYNQFDNTRTLRKMSYHSIQIEQIIEFDNVENQDSYQLQFSYLETLTKTALRPYFEIPRLTTEAYLSYIESLIQTPKKLINAVDPIFYAQKYVQQQYGLQHIFNGHLQRLIASMYSEFLINKRVKDLEQALQQGQDNKILFLKQEILTKTRVYLESRVKNKCTQQMEKKYQETKQFLRNKIKTLLGIKDGISQDVVCRWSIQAANESLIIYQKHCQDFKYESNPNLGLLYSTYADIFFVQNRVVQTQYYLDLVKQTLEYCYTTISNPDYCRFFFQQGYVRLHILSILKLYIEALIGLKSLTPSEKYEVLISIVTEEKNILQHFDQFCAHGFFLFLERNIQKQLGSNKSLTGRLTQSYRKDQQDLIRYLQIEGEKLAFQKTIDANSRPYPHIVENIYKDAIHLIEKSGEKFNPDYTGLELFIKSFQICKLLLSSENTIYQKVLALVNKLSNRKNSLM